MKFYPLNLGCKVNAYELRAVCNLLIKEGHVLGNVDNYDIAIINTCSVTHVAAQKSRQHISKLRKKNKNAIIIVIGCYANENDCENIVSLGANIIVGVNNYLLIPSLIKKYIKNKETIIKISKRKDLRCKAKYEELGISNFSESTRAYVKISDGCNNFCSYCIIPFNRGRLRSRNKVDILNEVRTLIELGYKEIVLTGIDISSYGEQYKNYHLSDLLEEILIKNPDLYRLRLSSIEISEIDDNFLSILKKYKNFANHLHIPLQSGCDETLKRMNRKYTTKLFLEKINKIRKIRKDISITTDVIVGFPLESEEEFNKTFAFIKEINFYELHVFPYSKREGTLASKYKDLDSLIKKERVHKLLDLNKQLKENYQNKFINKDLEVLFESDNSGFTSNYIKVRGNYPSNTIKKIKISKNNLIR